jgi:hypothetical protein
LKTSTGTAGRADPVHLAVDTVEVAELAGIQVHAQADTLAAPGDHRIAVVEGVPGSFVVKVGFHEVTHPSEVPPAPFMVEPSSSSIPEAFSFTQRDKLLGYGLAILSRRVMQTVGSRSQPEGV